MQRSPLARIAGAAEENWNRRKREMKAKKRHIKHLKMILSDMIRARDYIMDEEHAICKRVKHATTTLHYTRPDGDVLYEVTKEYGSKLCRLFTAISSLRNLIESLEEDRKNKKG